MLRPTIGEVSIGEAEALLLGVRYANERQMMQGTAPLNITALLHPMVRRIRYERRDPGEHFQTARELAARGLGDCEDLAAAVAAEYTLKGRPSVVRIIPSADPTVVHAVVQDLHSGRLYDPSLLGGMNGWPWMPMIRARYG